MTLIHVGRIPNSLYRRRSKINVILLALTKEGSLPAVAGESKDPSCFLFLRAMNLDPFRVFQLEGAVLWPLS